MTTPLVRGAYREPLVSEEYAAGIMDNHGYGELRKLLGQPPITGMQALDQISRGVPIDGRTLTEMYSGVNTSLANILQMDIRDAKGPLFQICPLEQTTNIGKRTLYLTRHKQTVLGPLSTFGLVRHMNFTQSSRSFELQSYGIGFQFEMQSLLEQKGRDIFNQYVTMAGTATLLTGEVIVMAAIVGCHETAKALDRFFPQTAGSLTDLISTWNDNAFAIHKQGNGIQRVVSWIRRARQLLKISEPQALLVPPTTAEQLALGNPEARDVMRAGQEAVAVRTSGASVFSSVMGMSLIEIPPETINDTNSGVYDALLHTVEIGLFYVAFAGDNRADKQPYCTKERSIAIFTMENNGNRKVVPLTMMIQNDLAFDAASGQLNYPLLKELAESYDERCRQKQMALHQSANGDPLVDPNIAFDEDRVPFVVRYWGDVDPAYLSERFICQLARINHQQLQRRLGKQAMLDIRAMLEVLDESASYGISTSTDQSSVIEAFAAAVALHDSNVTSANKISATDRATNVRVGLTIGNTFGADTLPPLSPTGQIATLNGGAVRPITFVTNNSLRNALSEGNKTECFYVARNATQLTAMRAAVTTLDFSNILAPTFPPGCSSGNWAAYIAAGMNNGDQGIQSWITNRDASRVKFETVARGWRAFERYFDAQHAVFSLSKDKNAENPLMNPDSCPSFIAPSQNNDSLRAKLAYFQQVFIGMRGPLAIGNVFNESGVVAIGSGLFLCTISGVFLNPTNNSLTSDNAGLSTTSRYQETDFDQEIQTGFQANSVSTTTAFATMINDTSLAIRRAIDNVPSLNSALIDALVKDQSSGFRNKVRAAMDRAGARNNIQIPNGLVTGDDPILILLNTPIAAFGKTRTRGGGRDVSSTFVTLVQSDKLDLAVSFLNRLWAMILPENSKLTLKNLDIIATQTLSADAGTSEPPSATRVSQMESGLRQYDDDIGKNLPARTAGNFWRTTEYTITRLQVKTGTNGGLFSNVTDMRAYMGFLRPVSFQNYSRVIAPFQLNIANMDHDSTGIASIADLARNINTNYTGPSDSFFLPTGQNYRVTHNLRTKGRADSYVDRTNGSSSSLYTNHMDGGADASALGPVSFYIEDNQRSHGGADVGASMGKRFATSMDSNTGSASSSSSGPYKRAMGGASVHSFAGVHYDNYYPPSATDVGHIITRDASESDPFSDLVLFGSTMLTASRWQIARFGMLHRMFSCPLERAMAVTFLMTPVHRDLLLHMAQCDYEVPRSYLLMQPFIRLNVYAAYAVTYGIGRTYYAFPNVSLGMDANTLLCTARFSTKMGAVIMSPEQITPIPLFKFGEYHSGASTAVVAPGTIYSDMMKASYGAVQQYTYDPQNYAERRGDLFIIGVGCDATSFGDELPLGGFYRPSGISTHLSDQLAADLMRARYPAALYMDMLCGFSKIGRQQDGMPNVNDNYHLLTDMVAPLSESYAGRLLFQGPQNNYNPVTGDYDRVFSAGTGPTGAMRPNCGEVIKGQNGMISYMETQRTVTQPLAIHY